MNGGPKRIIVAEDDPGIVEVIKIILEEEGHQIEIASSKKEVESLVETFHPHIIFLDILLQGDTGQDIAASLKISPLAGNIPIILLSANSELKEIAKKAGVTGYLQKPFEISELLETIQKHT